MITTFEFAFCIIALAILWFDVFQMPMRIKTLLKMPVHKLQKPLDCFFCTCFWFSLTAVLVLSPVNAIVAILITLTISKFTSWVLYQ
jgi:hypothetical protein